MARALRLAISPKVVRPGQVARFLLIPLQGRRRAQQVKATGADCQIAIVKFIICCLPPSPLFSVRPGPVGTQAVPCHRLPETRRRRVNLSPADGPLGFNPPPMLGIGQPPFPPPPRG